MHPKSIYKWSFPKQYSEIGSVKFDLGAANIVFNGHSIEKKIELFKLLSPLILHFRNSQKNNQK